MRIAIIGSGVSGLTCAHILSAHHDVVVFESDGRPGGHANTVTVDLDGVSHQVDTGFIVYNERNYPIFSALLEELGVDGRDTEMSFAVSDDEAAMQAIVQSPLALQILQVFAPANLNKPLPENELGERMRARFNHRFNAYAPEWGVDLQHGRSLEDYAGVIPRLQQVWARPLDEMAELEALLFRKSRGDLFELPWLTRYPRPQES